MNVKFRPLPKLKCYNGQHREGALGCRLEGQATFHCNNTGFIRAFDTVIMRSFAELWRAPLKNQNMLTGSNMLCLGSLSELGEGQGRVECRYQGCVLLPCVSHLYVCVSPADAGAPVEMWEKSSLQS